MNNKKYNKKLAKWEHLLGKDFCSCGKKMECKGVCRKLHLAKDGTVKCHECYQLTLQDLGLGKKRRDKKTWKYEKKREVSDD